LKAEGDDDPAALRCAHSPTKFLAVLITAVTEVTQRDITGLLQYHDEVDKIYLKEK
jgi:hypothetical protein